MIDINKYYSYKMMPGGFGDVMEVGEDVKILAINMKEKVEETLGETF